MLVKMITLRSLRTRPLRTLLSAFGIVLGVAGILAIGITNMMALNSVSRLFKNTAGNSSLMITSASSESEGFKDRALRQLNVIEGIAAVVPSIQVRTNLSNDAPDSIIDLNIFGQGMGGLLLYGIDPALDRSVREYKLVAGQFLSGDLTAYEMVLVQSYADEKEIKLGDRITIITPNGLTRMRVIGLIDKDGPGQLNNGAFGVLPIKTAQQLFNRSGLLDQVDILADAQHNTAAALELMKVAVQERLGETFAVVFPASQGKRMTQMLNSYQIGLNFLSGMALFVGAFLIYNAFSMTVVERTREFGMLRTVGMTRRQIILQVLSEALVLGVIGSALGVGLGILLAGGLSRLMEVLLGSEFGALEIPPDVLATSIGVGVVVTLVAAALPAFQAGRISPLEALRIRGTMKEGWVIRRGWTIGAVLLAVSAVILVVNPFPYDVQFRLGSLTVFLLFLGGTLMIPVFVNAWEAFARPLMQWAYGSAGRLGSRNVRRARQRTTLTVSALVMGVAMILIVRGMTESFKVDLVDWMNSYIGGDLFASSSVTMRNEVWRQLEVVDGVAAASPVRYFEVKYITPEGMDEPVVFMATDPEAHSRVTKFTFSDSNTDQAAAIRKLALGDAVFVSSVLAEKYNLVEGGTVRLKTRTGLHDFTIAAVVVDFFNQGLVIDGSFNDMRRYFKINDISAFLMKVEKGYNVAEVRQRIEDQLGKKYRLTIESNAAIKERAMGLMSAAFSMFDVLAYIALIVASLGVVNTLMMNVMERTQEIGMLRGVGMTRWQVVKMVLAEAGMMGMIGGLIGLVFGVLLSRIFLVAMMAMSGYQLTFRMPVTAIATALVIAVIVSQIAAIWPARRAAGIRILDAIHYE